MSQKASGKADSCTDNSDKEVTECPTCGKDDFDSEQYMKVHHSHAHGESIAGKAVDCANCGETIRVMPNTLEKRENHYCSNECMGEHRQELYSGDGHPRWQEDKPTFECENCGKSSQIQPYLEDKKRFCSMDCKAEWQEENLSGEEHPAWNGGKLEVECETCGDPIERKPSHVEDVENCFCSYDCHREHQSKHQVGENHHNYEGGRMRKYGRNWNRQRTKAIQRDNGECQRCGVHRSKLDRDIHVHHITKRREFVDENGSYDYERGNRLENLICLCPSCHKLVESWGIEIQ